MSTISSSAGSEPTRAPALTMSHYEVRAHDFVAMLDFYTAVLGFVITDRGPGPHGLTFLSRSADEHHQVVLNPDPAPEGPAGRLDHIAFRVESLKDLRNFHSRLMTDTDREVATVTHGTTWSLYFHDPDGNRLEIFADTPWYVDQPTRLPIDLDVTDSDLLLASEQLLASLPGFTSQAKWQAEHRSSLGLR